MRVKPMMPALQPFKHAVCLVLRQMETSEPQEEQINYYKIQKGKEDML